MYSLAADLSSLVDALMKELHSATKPSIKDVASKRDLESLAVTSALSTASHQEIVDQKEKNDMINAEKDRMIVELDNKLAEARNQLVMITNKSEDVQKYLDKQTIE